MARNRTSETQFDTRVLDALIRNLDGEFAEAVARVAFTVEGIAKTLAPVDTGALRASIYTSLKGGGNFDAARSDAIGRSNRRNGAGQIKPLDSSNFVQLPVPRSDTVAHVGPSVEYGAGVEFGTARRNGTPFLLPALRQAEDDLRKELGKAIQDAK
jgi:hypothetical protein